MLEVDGDGEDGGGGGGVLEDERKDIFSVEFLEELDGVVGLGEDAREATSGMLLAWCGLFILKSFTDDHDGFEELWLPYLWAETLTGPRVYERVDFDGTAVCVDAVILLLTVLSATVGLVIYLARSLGQRQRMLSPGS